MGRLLGKAQSCEFVFPEKDFCLQAELVLLELEYFLMMKNPVCRIFMSEQLLGLGFAGRLFLGKGGYFGLEFFNRW